MWYLLCVGGVDTPSPRPEKLIAAKRLESPRDVASMAWGARLISTQVAAVSRDAPHMSIFFNRGNAHELGAPTSSHGGFRRLDAPFISPQTGACAVAAFTPRRNASTFSVAYAARHSSVSFGVVTLPRTS
jgi:hypothetical protein